LAAGFNRACEGINLSRLTDQSDHRPSSTNKSNQLLFQFHDYCYCFSFKDNRCLKKKVLKNFSKGHVFAKSAPEIDAFDARKMFKTCFSTKKKLS
jgi:hypothetical protein